MDTYSSPTAVFDRLLDAASSRSIAELIADLERPTADGQFGLLIAPRTALLPDSPNAAATGPV
jgi:hypothetical protein